MKKIRLDRLLGNLGYGSRNKVKELVRRKMVSFNGEPLTDFSADFELTEALRDSLAVEGEKLDLLPGFLLMLHKPVDYTCSHKEEGQLVYELFPQRWRERNPPLSSVGRLDKDTSGLLLLTDDGELLHKLASPKKMIEKCYLVHLDRPLRGDEAKVFASGTLMLESEKKPLLPARLEIIHQKLVKISITEGRYHQVRRMFAAVGNHALSLHRESFGKLVLPKSLAPGEYQFLDAKNWETLI